MPFFCIITLALYAIMEITDALDGAIARKRGLVTDLGKVFDPFSDCFMHLSFFACFVYFGKMSFIAFLIILWRELLINFVRMLLSGQKVVLAANIFGKFKTVFYAFLSLCIIVYTSIKPFLDISGDLNTKFINVFYILSYMAAFFSAMSFIIYMSRIVKSKALSSITK